MGKNEELVAEAKRVLLGNYKPPAFVLHKGQGCRVEDVEGHRYLDLAAGIAVLSLGHAHKDLARAVSDQAQKLVHTSNLFYNDRAIALASAILARTGYDKVYFCNSGTEANEALLKLARRWHFEHGRKERVEIVATLNSFHGRTMGSLSMTGQAKYHLGMGPLLPGVKLVPYGDLEAMRAAITDKTAAVMVEPIQAEGGIIVGSEDYLRGLRTLCDAQGALLFFDEVQTGYGRTGKFLGREWTGVKPDAFSLAKGIAGGFPLGAMVVAANVADGLPPASHASTFGGNPVMCAAGLAVLEVFDRDRILDNVMKVGVHLETKLAAIAADSGIPAAAEARGRGLLQGLRLDKGIDPIATVARIREAGVLLSIAGGDVIRISPPLIVTEAEIDEGLDVMVKVLRNAPAAVAA